MQERTLSVEKIKDVVTGVDCWRLSPAAATRQDEEVMSDGLTARETSRTHARTHAICRPLLFTCDLVRARTGVKRKQGSCHPPPPHTSHTTLYLDINVYSSWRRLGSLSYAVVGLVLVSFLLYRMLPGVTSVLFVQLFSFVLDYKSFVCFL